MSSQAAGPGPGAPAPPALGQVLASPLSFSISTSGTSFVVPKAPCDPRMDLLSGVRFKVCRELCVGASNQTHFSDNKEKSLFCPKKGSAPPLSLPRCLLLPSASFFRAQWCPKCSRFLERGLEVCSGVDVFKCLPCEGVLGRISRRTCFGPSV